MNITNYTAVVAKNDEIAPDIYEIALKLIEPSTIDFRAGQFVNLHIPGAERLVMRPYSIASAPFEKDHILLCYKKVSEGIATPYMAKLKPGDQVVFTGVFGEFVLHEDAKNNILFLAGGVGITPIYSMILQLLKTKSPRQATLYFSVRSRNDLFYYHELKKLADEHANFQLITALTRDENAGPEFRQGRITAMLEEDLVSADNLEAYICGSKELVNDVKAVLLKKGMVPELVYCEKFY